MNISNKTVLHDDGSIGMFITREFAEAMEDDSHLPYLRLHDPVQRFLVDYTASEKGQGKSWRTYYEATLHFWREVSVMGLPRGGRGADEVYALLFESVFTLALTQPDWAEECLESLESEERSRGALKYLAHHANQHTRDHEGMVLNFQSIGAVDREGNEKWEDPKMVARYGAVWFGVALICACRVDDNHPEAWFRRGMVQLSEIGWDDDRIHMKIIREAGLRSPVTSRGRLHEHPLIRLARRNYRDGSTEQCAVLEFLNQQCILAGFESEEDFETSDLELARWIRDARTWAAKMRKQSPERFAQLIEESGPDEVARIRSLYDEDIVRDIARLDAIDTARALIKWGHSERGHDRSRTRGEVWDFMLKMVDAAVWISWVFPNPIRK